MATALSTIDQTPPIQALENVLINGDLAGLKAADRISYYKAVCESVGLNPLTKPFEYITLNGKMVLYALKACTDQLRSVKNISLKIVGREFSEGVYVVTAQATMPSGRCDESTGAVPIEHAKGEARANALMKAETKAKRRVTLSICGLGMLDETEIDSIPGATGSKELQQEVLKRKFKELEEPEESSAPEPAAAPEPKPAISSKVPPEVDAIWKRMGNTRDGWSSQISDLSFELMGKFVGNEQAMKFCEEALKKYEVKSSFELNLKQARELVWQFWLRITEKVPIAEKWEPSEWTRPVAK